MLMGLLTLFLVSLVGPTMDLSGFKNGLEVFVPNALTIRVPITGYPTPKAKWMFGDKELTPGDRISMVTKPTYTELIITPSVRPDKGTYTLQLENDVTLISGEIEVNVIGMSYCNFQKKNLNHIIYIYIFDFILHFRLCTIIMAIYFLI